LSTGSSSRAPHIMLHEIGVDFESRWISFAKREQHAPEYLKLNPEGKVPTLLVNGRPLTEVAAGPSYSPQHRSSRATKALKLNPEGKAPTLLVNGRPLTEVAAALYYLAKRFPEAGLFPEGNLEAEAQIISWMSFITPPTPSARRLGGERGKEVFEIAEKRLARQDWAVGRYSIADIHLFRLFWRFFDS